MKALKFFLAAAILGGALMTTPSCGKYEEGPGFTLLTKKARLSREWDAKEYVSVDGEVMVDNSDDYVTFEKDGTYKATDGGTSFVGTWEFVSDKEKVRTAYMFGNTEIFSDWTIIRLTKEELWVKDSDGDMTKFEAR
jgi:hypothetical protein